MIPRDPSPESTVALAAHLGETFGFVVQRKERSEICQLAARVLEALGIQSATAFLGSYVTTLPSLTGPGSVVYTPFDLGIEQGPWSIRAQHDVVVHEACHAATYQREGMLYAARYLCSQYDRAIYEGQAYCTRGELAFLRCEPMPSPQSLAEHLRAYACGQEAIDACVAVCDSLLTTAAAGGRSEVGRAVEEWWARRGA